MSDIVERLRAFRSNPDSERWDAIAYDAAQEIERLRADNEMLRAFRDMVRKEVGRVASLMEIPKP